jgi:hypothetical protein
MIMINRPNLIVPTSPLEMSMVAEVLGTGDKNELKRKPIKALLGLLSSAIETSCLRMSD